MQQAFIHFPYCELNRIVQNLQKLLEWALTYVELYLNMPEIRLEKTINLKLK